MAKSTTKLPAHKSKSSSVITGPAHVVEARYSSALGVDVHAQLLVCAFQRMHDHKIETVFANFETGRSGLAEFAAWCKECDPCIVVMESTGVLWRSPYEALEAAGFTADQLALVNARDVKAVIGRKTDREDAKRLAEIARVGNIRKSFVPTKEFRDMRTLARLYQKQVSDIATHKNRFHKLLNSAGCRASSVFSDIRGVAATAIIRALLLEPDSFARIVAEKSRRLRASAAKIRDALAFEISPVMCEQLTDELHKIDQSEQAAERTMLRLKTMQEPYSAQISRLQSIPGIKETAARLIFAELTDQIGKHFSSSEKFCSWMGICPGNKISADKSYSGAAPKGNKWLRRTLVECAHGIGLSKCIFKETFTVFKMRCGTRRAVVAISHLLARIIYAILKTGKDFINTATRHSVRDERCKRLRREVRELNRMTPQGEPRQALIARETGEILGVVPAQFVSAL